jgi:hypothetical protein
MNVSAAGEWVLLDVLSGEVYERKADKCAKSRGNPVGLFCFSPNERQFTQVTAFAY